MLWSGLTKYIWSMIHIYQKAVEIPGLGIIGPIYEKWADLANPLEKGPLHVTQNKLRAQNLLFNIAFVLE